MMYQDDFKENFRTAANSKEMAWNFWQADSLIEAVIGRLP